MCVLFHPLFLLLFERAAILAMRGSSTAGINQSNGRQLSQEEEKRRV